MSTILIEFKVHVWGGISRHGATKICIFTGKLEQFGFQTILKDYLIPFGNEAFQGEYRLVQDNDPKHTSKSTKKFLRNRNINHCETPPESPVSKNVIEYFQVSNIYKLSFTFILGFKPNRNGLGLHEMVCS